MKDPQEKPVERTIQSRSRVALSAKEERFAIAIACGARSVEAMAQAGYKVQRDPKNASSDANKINGRLRVQNRIKELRDDYAKKVIEANRGVVDAARAPRAYSVHEAMDELDEAWKLAKDKENPPAMVKVVEVRMKLYGLGIAEAKNPNDKEVMDVEDIYKALNEVRSMKAGLGVKH